jgi:membrane protein DedA with SNARE-associated domain
MTTLSSLHGVVASLVICSLLFIDETGMPVPLAPNELLLLFGGVLTRTGIFSAWLFYPLAFACMAAGMLVGYGWSRLVGQTGLDTVVRRVHGETAYRRLQERLQAAGPASVGVARLLPGIRPWATLCCGASGVGVGRFLVGALPALLLWEVGWVTLGVVVGLPAAHLLGGVERLVLQGAILIALGAVGYVGLRRLSRDGAPAQARRGIWLLLTLCVVGSATASTAAGVLAVGRGLVGDEQSTWIDTLVVGVLVAVVASAVLLKNLRSPHEAEKIVR